MLPPMEVLSDTGGEYRIRPEGAKTYTKSRFSPEGRRFCSGQDGHHGTGRIGHVASSVERGPDRGSTANRPTPTSGETRPRGKRQDRILLKMTNVAT